jgi:hypothetical protein
MPLSETFGIYLDFLIDCQNLIATVMGRAMHLITKGDMVYEIHSISVSVEKCIYNSGKKT